MPSAQPFEVSVKPRGKTLLVHLAGHFDLTAKKRFEAVLQEVFSGKAKEVIIDLRELVFIDSAGLRLLLEAWNVAKRKGIDFAVLPGSSQVQEVLKVTGLDQVLPLVQGVPASEYKGTEASGGNGALVS